MTPQQHRIIAKAKRYQRAGRTGDSIKLRILASEAATMRFGDETVHGPGDAPE
jgi:hypothetical protein